MANFHYFTRRAYNASKSKFSNNKASLTRYVELPGITDTVTADQILDRDDWAGRVLAAANGGPILCFVHGFNTTQIDMLNRLKKIRDGLSDNGFRGAVIAHDWPSQGTIPGYITDRNNAKKIAPFMVTEGLGPFMAASPGTKLHILAHSMGSLVTIRSFAQTGDGGSAPWSVDQVMLVSADCDAVEMAKGTGDALVMDKRSARLTNYFSNQDRVLKLGENIVSGGRDRLGFAGMPTPKEPGTVDVACGTRYDQSIDKPANGFEEQTFSHTWYFDDDLFYRDVANTLAGIPTDQMGNTRGILGGTGPDFALKP